MKLLTVLVTHNRLELTKLALESYKRTTSVPNFLVVVDNASSDGTGEYLREQYLNGTIDHYIESESNLYPGGACNLGWEKGLELYPEATHLHRADNDLLFRTGWDIEVMRCFADFPLLGQLGTMNQEQEFPIGEVEWNIEWSGNSCINRHWQTVGGPNVIAREVWDRGLRYDDSPWHHFGQPTGQEDVKLSLAIKALGYTLGNTVPDLVHHLGDRAYMKDSPYIDYYRKTFSDRGYDFQAWLDGNGASGGAS